MTLPTLPLEEMIALAVAGVILLAVAALLIGIGWFSRQKVKASQAWPSTPGRIVGSGVEVSSGSEGGNVYRAVVTYRYQVGGQVFQNNRRVFGDTVSSSNRGAAERTAARFVAGSSVPVYYNPANPQDAVLERKSGVAGLMFGLGALFVVLGCGLAGCAVTLAANGLIKPAGLPPAGF
jgi:hypothetical protein